MQTHGGIVCRWDDGNCACAEIHLYIPFIIFHIFMMADNIGLNFGECEPSALTPPRQHTCTCIDNS